MTGWRVGWLQAPKALGSALERIIQYNTSGTAAFLQRGCIVALDEGESFVEEQIAKACANRDLVTGILGALPRLRSNLRRELFTCFSASRA